MITFEEQIRNENIKDIANKLMAAARTAPKARGTDNHELAVATDDTIVTLAEQMKQLQLEEQQLKNEKLKSEIQENYAQAQKYQAEAMAGPELMDPADRELKAAQAANLRAQADQKNMDTVRKLTGADHNEKMAQMRAQAEGNQDLEVTKALLNCCL